MLIALLLAATTARADFDSLVRAVGSTRGLHRIWTPGISLVRIGVRIVHPEGVHDLQLVVFEGDGNVDIERVMQSTPDMPIVRTHNNHTGETAVIWARPVGRDLVEMLLVTHDPGDDTVVIRTVVDGDVLAREVADPRHPPHLATR